MASYFYLEETNMRSECNGTYPIALPGMFWILSQISASRVAPFGRDEITNKQREKNEPCMYVYSR